MQNPADKFSIAIDADDVLAAHADAFIRFSNANYGTNFTVEDYHDDWPKLWNISHEEMEERAKRFHITESVAKYELIKEADNALVKLGDKYRLFLVTARPKHNTEPTHEWINRNFPGLFEAIHFAPIWELNNTVTKADICRQIGAEYLIDDLPRHCNLAAQSGIKALLFGDYSWNRYEEVEDGVTRVKNWQQVLEYFDDKS